MINCADRIKFKYVRPTTMVKNFLLRFVVGATDDFDTLMVYDTLIEDMYGKLCE